MKSAAGQKFHLSAALRAAADPRLDASYSRDDNQSVKTITGLGVGDPRERQMTLRTCSEDLDCNGGQISRALCVYAV